MRLRDLCDRITNRLLLRMTRRAATLVFLCSVTSMYLLFATISAVYKQPWYKYAAPCVQPKSVMDEMAMLTYDVSSLLTKLKINHTLCYGTLWGALRYGKTLPWDNNVDFCVLKSEIEKVSWDTLVEKFKASKMDVAYDFQHGLYMVNRGQIQAYITVFYKTSHGEAVRDGFQHKFLWFLKGNSVSFSSKLLEPPFAEIMFHGWPMPVPNNDIEMLKHLYKDSWWLEEPPQGCPNGNT